MAAVASGCAGADPESEATEDVDARPEALAQSLTGNRDRLLTTLAQRKGWGTCDQWAAMNEGERAVFLTITKVLASHNSYVSMPWTHVEKNDGGNCDYGCTLQGSFNCPWGYTNYNDEWVSAETCTLCGGCWSHISQDNTETLLDHATALYSVNGPDPSGGCGGGEYNRIFLGFDEVGKGAIRNWTISGGTWSSSDDCAGPHGPFTASETIGWGTGAAPPWCGAFFWGGQEYGPQRHHWRYDWEATSLAGRLGLCDAWDPSMTEIDVDYNWLHDSNPLCGGGMGAVEQHMGAAEYGYVPSGCPFTPANPGYGGGLGCGS